MMSGGVDSSVAAYLLKKRGHEVVGVFMRCYNLDGCAERDAEDARRVAEKLKIPFYVWDFENDYKKKVVDYMIDGYRRGITPNPDIMCNKEIKFGLFLKKALEMGAPACRQAGIYIASGHYVRLRKFQISNSKHQTNSKSKIQNPKKSRVSHLSLSAAKDNSKDQSYFLWTLTQEQLKHCLFPVGDYLKSEIREMARKAGLPTAEKKDSQGICFLGKVTLDEFLGNYLPEKQGKVILVNGEAFRPGSGQEIGEHKGAHFYTIGQRHFGVANGKWQRENGGNPKRLYITEKDIKNNVLVVAADDRNSALYKKEIELTDVNFINPSITPSLIRANGKIDILARIRYRQPLVKAKLINLKPKTYKLIFAELVKFIASGQSAVFYEYKKNPSTSSGLKMLGGGVIV